MGFIERTSAQQAKENAKQVAVKAGVPTHEQTELVIDPTASNAVQVPDPQDHPGANGTEVPSPHDEPTPNEVAEDYDDSADEQPADAPANDD